MSMTLAARAFFTTPFCVMRPPHSMLCMAVRHASLAAQLSNAELRQTLLARLSDSAGQSASQPLRLRIKGLSIDTTVAEFLCCAQYAYR